MKHTSKKTLLLLLALLLLASLFPTAALAELSGGAVYYLDESGSIKTYSCTPVTASAVEWSGGWYAVSENVTISGQVTVNGTVNLVLLDGCTLTVNSDSYGISVSRSAALNIYAGSTGGAVRGTGALSGRIENEGPVTVNGGTVNASGEIGVSNENVFTVNGGTVNARGTKSPGMFGGGGWGISNLGIFTVNGGTVNASGSIRGISNDGTLTVGSGVSLHGGNDANSAEFIAKGEKAFNYNDLPYQYVTIVAPNPVASVTSGGTTTKYADLSTAVSNWTAGSTLKLLADVETASTISVPSGAHTLDLNGYGIRMTGSGSVISVPSGAALTLNDSSPSVAHSYSLSGYLATAGSGDYSFTGGYITGGSTSGEGGGVHVDGTFTMYGGTIIGNSASKGGGVCVDTGASMAMSGGAIRYNVGIYKSGDITVNGDGGGIVVYGSLNMSGGRVCDNHSGWGGGIEARGGSAFILSGGTITGNSVEDAYDSGGASIQYPAKGGGVLIYNTATFQLSGSPVINGNELNDLYLDSDAVCAVVGALGSSVSIPVTMATPGVFTTGGTSYNVASRFTSDNTGYAVGKNADGQLFLGTPVASVTSGGTTTKYADLSTAVSALPANGTLKLLADVTTSEQYTLDKTCTVDLNGHTITGTFGDSSGAYLFSVSGGTVTFTDTSGAPGTISATGGAFSSCIVVNNDVNVIFENGVKLASNSMCLRIFYDGTHSITINNAEMEAYQPIYACNGTVTINGGVIRAGAWIGQVDRSTGKMTINGGTFYGGCICRNGATLEIRGGTFNGSVSDSNEDGNLEIYGGSFANKPDDYLLAASGKVFAYDGEYWQVVDSTDPVCTVGSLYYQNLSEALSNWTAGSTLTLLKDVTTASTITVPDGAHTLDLNGHGLRMTGSGSVISVPSGASLTLNDSNPDAVHKYTIGNPKSNGAGLAVVDDQTGSTVFTGGYITGGATTTGSKGGGVYLSGGSLTMNGGTLIGNSAEHHGGAVSVHLNSTFTMNGGAIIGNRGWYGGGLSVTNGSNATVSGGVIQYNYSTQNAGGVHTDGTDKTYGTVTLTLTGGTIRNNYTDGEDGGVLIDTASFNLSGNPTIEGNQRNGSSENLYLSGNSTINITGTLTNTTPIPVKMQTPGVFTDSANTSYNDASKFTSDDANYRVLADTDGQLTLHALYTVTLTGGANAAVSGDTTQSELTGAMEAVSYTANTGYHFEEFNDVSESGVTTHWVDTTHVTVSGTPEADVEITVPAAVINTYTVTWMNGDAAVETDTDVPYGSDASYNGGTPEKEQDADYTYTFAGWTPAPGTVTADATYTASFTAVPKYAYQLYYLLDSATDADGDIYMDYGVGDTVTATLYLKNTTGADMTLQAFDLYVTNDAKLTYAGFTPASGSSAVRVESGTSASDATTQHIQLIGAKDGDGYTSPGVTLTNGAAVALGTLSFTIDSDAVYNTGLPIAIIGGDNTRKANIAVANDQNSYYPTVTAPVLGAEVMTQYAVTYEDGLRVLSIEPETKGYNTAYTVKYTTESEWASVSVPAGKYFMGWAESENGEVVYALGEDAAEIAASVNENVTLYAVWGITRHTVSYTGEGVTEQSSTLDYGTAFPAYSGGTPAKEATVSTVYSFAGWDMNNDGTADTLPATVTEDVTLVSVFTASVRTYTVSFDVGAGSVTNAPAAQTVAYNGHAARPATDPSLANFVFMGWYTTDQYTETFDFDSTAITGNTTVYAKWIDASYDVTLEENGGSYIDPDTEPTSYDYGVGLTLPTAENIEKTGYAFGGWYADSGFSGEAVTAIGITDAGDKTFYAKWTPITYQVRFNPNNGSGSMANQTFTYDEAQSLNEIAFTRANYSFKGWTTAANPATDAPIVYADKASVTNLASTQGAVVELYAVWTLDPLTITYEVGDNATNPNTTTTYTVEGENVVFTAPTRPGYSFASWTAKKAGTNETVELTGGNTLPVSTAANVTLTANWNPVSYTITYEGEGTLPDNKTYTIETNDYTLPTPTRDGYTFGGWKATTVAAETNWELNTVYPAGTAVTGKYGDVTLTAQWTETSYTVSYDTDGGNELDALSYTITSTDTLATPTRTGYSFAGWKISTTAGNWAAVDTILANSDGSNTFTLSGNYGNVELQAQWTPVSYSIGYTLDGGTVDTANPTTYTIETATFTLNNPTRIGYTFKGWSGTDLTGDENTAVSIAQGSTGNRTYTANWTANTYHVKFYQYPEGTAGENPVVTGGDQTYTVENTGITVPAVPTVNGYDGAWSSYSIDTANPADIDVYPSYTAHSYTVTFAPNGGADIAVDAGNGITALNTMTYNIESTYTLPTTTNGLYSFKGWKATTAGGNWTADALFSPDSTSGAMPAVTGKYGDVTLTAQWEFEIGHAVDEYKYAYTGWRMLRIDASGLGEKESYAYDGELMYYTDDENYRLNGKPVYYTLIPASSDTLTADQIALITVQNHVVTPRSINYTGDVNGDKAINIADANIVFQMLASGSAGGYYTVSQLSTAERLAADLVKGTDNADHRGSIADVSSIVTAINNGTSSTSDDVFTEATVEISGTAQGVTGNLPGTNDPQISGFGG